MAQSKLNDLAGKFGKGGPPGLTTGLKVLAAIGAAAYGINNSMYTGEQFPRGESGRDRVCGQYLPMESKHNLKEMIWKIFLMAFLHGIAQHLKNLRESLH